MNRNGRQAPGLAKLGLAPPVDPRLLRTKMVLVDLGVLIGLLQLDGTKIVRMEGWPEGAEVVGWRLENARQKDGSIVPRVVLILHHPDFPVVLAGPNGSMPPQHVKITIHVTPVEVKEAVDAREE